MDGLQSEERSSRLSHFQPFAAFRMSSSSYHPSSKSESKSRDKQIESSSSSHRHSRSDRDRDRDRDRGSSSKRRSRSPNNDKDDSERDSKRHKHRSKDDAERKSHKERQRERDDESESDSEEDAIHPKLVKLGSKPIDSDDYFQKASEFKAWLLSGAAKSSGKKLYLDEMNGKESRKWFDRFVKAWNRGQLIGESVWYEIQLLSKCFILESKD